MGLKPHGQDCQVAESRLPVGSVRDGRIFFALILPAEIGRHSQGRKLPVDCKYYQ